MSRLIEELPVYTDAFTENVLSSIKHQTETAKNPADLKLFKEWLLDLKKWRFPRVSFDTFIDDPMYLGVGHLIYPEIRKVARDIIDGKYSEGVFVAGIGSGKSTASELLACYAAHTLLCLRNPHATYDLVKDKPIAIMNMGINATQALEVTFAGIKSFIEKSPWFQQFSPTILAGSIRFKENNILLASGNSRSTTPLGYNVFCGILDEAAFYMDNDNKQVAEEIYTALQRRIVSRFGHDGLIIMISSPKYEGDFVMRKLEEAKKMPDQIFSLQLPTWKCKPIEKLDMANKFYFNNRLGTIVEGELLGEVTKVAEPFNALADIWEIPGEYRKSFVQDPDKAKRDFAAIPSATIQAFMPHPELINQMFTEQESPLQPTGDYKFTELPLRTNYYIHVDLAKNKDGKGDKAGLAMAHFDGWEYNEFTKERQKKVVIDLAEQIACGPTGEIRFEDVRNKIYALKEKGFAIKLVTFDTFQSADSVQILRAKGIRAELLSVDRTVEPYETFKELIYSKRVKCHQMPVLKRELATLEITKANKVDHSPMSSKDVADACCGAVYHVITNSGGEIGVATGDMTSISTSTQKPLSEKAKEYQQLQDLLNRGLI